MEPTTAKKPYLVITRAGSGSRHKEWLAKDQIRNYDLVLSRYHYDPECYVAEGVTEEFRPGPKVAGLSRLFGENSKLIQQYRYVALFDDDLSLTVEDINHLFARADELNVKICQPSLNWNSYFTFGALLHNPFCKHRFVNFIEMMCPVFRSDVLLRIIPLFGLGLEVGIDLLWCNAVYESPKDFAVIDDVEVLHTRPVGRLKESNGFPGGRTYEDDIYEALRLARLPWLSCSPYSGMLLNGWQINNRLLLTLLACGIMPAAFCLPSIWERLRKVLIHIRHVAIRPAFNLRTVILSEIPQAAACEATDRPVR